MRVVLRLDNGLSLYAVKSDCFPVHCYIELGAPTCNFPFRKQWYIAMGSGSCMRSEERDITVPPSLPNAGDFALFKAHGRRCGCNLYQKKKKIKGFQMLG